LSFEPTKIRRTPTSGVRGGHKKEELGRIDCRADIRKKRKYAVDLEIFYNVLTRNMRRGFLVLSEGEGKRKPGYWPKQGGTTTNSGLGVIIPV